MNLPGYVTEARDGMAEQDRQSVIADIERDQPWRDPRREDEREPALAGEHCHEERSVDGN